MRDYGQKSNFRQDPGLRASTPSTSLRIWLKVIHWIRLGGWGRGPEVKYRDLRDLEVPFLTLFSLDYEIIFIFLFDADPLRVDLPLRENT